MAGSGRAEGFDGAAAVTRSLLGWGVVAGPFYLVVGVILALTRDGFELSSHPLSLLMLGEHGWLQRANIILTGAMVLAASVGFARALQGSTAARRAGRLLGAYGVILVISGIFPPDPMEGFPPGTTQGDPTATGLIHFGAGAIGFVVLAVAAFVVGGWFAGRDLTRAATISRIAGVVVVVAFLGGGAVATTAAGVVLLWIAVVVGLAWLAFASVTTYRTVPHPDADRRAASPGG
jgi:hypothetical protein